MKLMVIFKLFDYIETGLIMGTTKLLRRGYDL
jgi:hypothetical protein